MVVPKCIYYYIIHLLKILQWIWTVFTSNILFSKAYRGFHGSAQWTWRCAQSLFHLCHISPAKPDYTQVLEHRFCYFRSCIYDLNATPLPYLLDYLLLFQKDSLYFIIIEVMDATVSIIWVKGCWRTEPQNITPLSNFKEKKSLQMRNLVETTLFKW